jgi:hypothetical protein
MSKNSEFLSVCLLSMSSLLSVAAVASQGGIPGYSQNPSGPNSCHACHTLPHSGAPANTLTITGSNTVLAGSTNSYTLRLAAPYSQNASYGGFDLSAGNGLLSPPNGESRIVNSELVHSNRKATINTGSNYEVAWNFNWQAPATAGSTSLYACGLPVNGDGRASPLMGDHHGATDGLVACTAFTIQIQQAPTASAGNNQTVVEGSGVTLDGSASGDTGGSIVSYSWVQTSGTAVTLSNANTVTASFTAPGVSATTELIFTLTVTDNDGLSDIDTVSVFVQDALAPPNLPPVASAGTDQNVAENTTVNLDASGSSDDGSIAGYLWEQTAGINTVVLNNATTATPAFTAPAVDSTGDVLTFQLTVTDNLGVSSTDTMTVTVSDVDTPPSAKITDASGVVISAISNNGLVTLYGNFSSDPEGPITAYSWSQTAGPAIVSPGSANENRFSFTSPDAPGNTIALRLTVTGNEGVVQASITASLTLNNLPPEADAGADQTVIEGGVIYLHGSVTDANNDLASVQWRQINCSGNCIAPPANVALPLIGNDAHWSVLAPAIAAENSGLLLEFELVATDSAGLSATATTQVTINDNGISGFPSNATSFTSFNNQPMALSIESMDPSMIAVITDLLPEDDASVADNVNRPTDFPYDLMNLEISLPASGSVMVTLYFPEPVPDNFDFYQYLGSQGWVNTSKAKNFNDLTFSGSHGWAEISEEVEFSSDRTRVAILLTDGGPSDDDGLVNGVIVNKGGLGVNPDVSVNQPGATGALHPLWLLLAGLLLLLARTITQRIKLPKMNANKYQ